MENLYSSEAKLRFFRDSTAKRSFHRRVRKERKEKHFLNTFAPLREISILMPDMVSTDMSG